MAIINVNGISGINSITAQSTSLNFYTAAGNTLSIGASVSGNITGNVTGNVVGNVTGNINSTGVSTVTTLSATSIVGVTTAGITTAYIGSVNDGPISGARNRIINGDMRIDQRNGGSSFSASAGTVTYGVDRFYLYQTGATVTGQRISSGLTDFPNAIRVTGASGNTASEVSQRIESVNCADLVGKPVTVSFTAAHSSNGTLAVALVYPGAADNWTSSTAIESKTQALTSTLTRYSLTFNALPSGVSDGLLLVFNNASGLGSGVTFTITGVQLEPGTVATPFERRSYGQELALAQRYFYSSTSTGTTQQFVNQRTNTSGSYGGAFPQLANFPVQMRAAPVVTTYTNGSRGNSGNVQVNGSTASTQFNSSTSVIAFMTWNAGAIPNVGDYYTFFLDANAEL